MKAERIYPIAFGCFLVVVAAACRESNPAFVRGTDAESEMDASGDGRGRSDGRAKDAANETVPSDALGRDGDPDASDAAEDDGPGADAPAPDTRDAVNRDGRDTRRDDVAGDGGADQVGSDAPADVPTPSDALDGRPVDGGPGPIDGLPVCQDSERRSCVSPGNPLLGACHVGAQTCTAGIWGPCLGEITPTAESCNTLDDNCNGLIDDGCTSGCVVVAPTGDDAAADGSPAHPFATIGAAMTFASSVDGGAPPRVCVAGGASCNDRKTYMMEGPLDILDGASVQGNYALSGGSLSACSTFPPITTLQFPATGEAVTFGNTQSAELGGFAIVRQTSVAPASTSIAGVRVSGGSVRLSALFIGEQSGAEQTYGVDVEDGDVTLTGSSISAGQGTASAVGVLVKGGTINLRNNCTLDSNGRCPSTCGVSDSTVLGIRGRVLSGLPEPGSAAESSAVYAAAGSATMVGNNLCGSSGSAAEAGRNGTLATVRCENGACATVAGNAIGATGNNVKQLAALSLRDGGGLVDGNLILGGCASDFAAAVLLENAPARLQNNRIVGASCIGEGTLYGVRILLGAGSGEPDLNANDIEPAGGPGNCESIGLSIERTAGQGAPATIVRNTIISTGICRRRFAVIDSSSARARVVENNDFYPSPTTSAADSTVLYRRNDTDAVTAEQINGMAGAAKNIAADPRYVSPTEMLLSSSSPCIDRGTAAGAPATDFAGNLRPARAGFDIGAYEFVGP